MFPRKEIKLRAKMTMKEEHLLPAFWGVIFMYYFLSTLFTFIFYTPVYFFAEGILSAVTEGSGIAVIVILTLCTFFSFLFVASLTAPFMIGALRYMIKKYQREPMVSWVEEMFFWGKLPLKQAMGLVWKIYGLILMLILGYAFFVIPGIILTFKWMFVPFILAERPALTGKEARKLSSQLTKGYLGKFFVLGLSFIGWFILPAIPCALFVFGGTFASVAFLNPLFAILGAILGSLFPMAAAAYYIPYITFSLIDSFIYLKANFARSLQGANQEADYVEEIEDGTDENEISIG